jgi:hypothetical protein
LIVFLSTSGSPYYLAAVERHRPAPFPPTRRHRPGAPETATQFFGITYDQASALGDSWLPPTGAAQRAAAGVIAAAVGPYVSPALFADVVLVPPGDINVDTGLEPGSTLLRSGTGSLTYRETPDPFIDYSTTGFDVRADTFGT